ncbi:hypothetical protein PAI11_06310 [Patulibacter medicamentivorans]|uniref:Peptidoglycan hydrolase PcsB coiled-coil domain-containing protein n=1 Tax=Patulibacter medicamentivorans TaxID=1097667 RepID=H0E1G9_9ACTN|nr:hypothetical protein [Patulibacter medicamentivorans]EHN12454.1 hypothetical protein PAI11_06310 [Patulibacter medicamentivorans]
MPPLARRRTSLRVLAVSAIGASALTVAAGAPTAGHADPAADRAAAQSLRAQVAAESRRIDATNAGLAQAEQRLATLDQRVTARRSQLTRTQDQLVRARIRLTTLERRADKATAILSENLVTAYENGRPDIVSVVLTSKGFADLLERVDFYKRISRQNGLVLDRTRDAKTAVAHQADDLEVTRVRFRKLAAEAEADRKHADVLRNALLRRQAAQLRQRAGTAGRLRAVRSRIAKLERQQAAAAAAAREATTATSAAPRSSNGGGPSAAGGGSVARVISAANEIASTPYVWGGGHGGASGGYDCSGSISYALAAAGLLSSPLDSTGFMSWGEPGPGKRITVYANAGHAFMIVDGRRFDTSALRGGGTRWTSESRSTAGFVARHPPGL